MKPTRLLAILMLGGFVFCNPAFADDADNDGSNDSMDNDTVTVVDEGDTPDSVTKTIDVPEAASATAREHAAFGHSVANQAREADGDLGRDFGQQVSEDARNRDTSNASEEVRQDLEREQRSEARGDNAGDKPPQNPGQN